MEGRAPSRPSLFCRLNGLFGHDRAWPSRKKTFYGTVNIERPTANKSQIANLKLKILELQHRNTPILQNYFVFILTNVTKSVT